MNSSRPISIIDWEVGELLPAHARKNHHELVFPVVRRLLDRVGLAREEIGLLASSGSDFLDGRGLTTMTIVDALGGHLLEECKVEDDGMWALLYARQRILAEGCDVALVVSYGKSSESDPISQTNAVFDPLVSRPLGLNGLAASALQASCYIAAGGGNDAQAARIASARRTAAARNDMVPEATPLSVEEAAEADFVLGPLRSTYLPAYCDGACAVLVGERDVAASLTERPVALSGAGHATDVYRLGDRDLTRARSAELAAGQCADRAGWGAERADVLEIAGTTPYEEMLVVEALGAAQLGKGGTTLVDGLATRVNPSGGLIGAHPVLLSGLVRVVEAAGRIRAGEAATALAHSTSGPALQANAVVALEAAA